MTAAPSALMKTLAAHIQLVGSTFVLMVPLGPGSDGLSFTQRPACGHVSDCSCQQLSFLNMLLRNAESGRAEPIQPEDRSTPAATHF